MMSGGWLLTVARPGRASRGSMEHSEGKGRESVVSIPRFLCGKLEG
jgi:hypothetical protein